MDLTPLPSWDPVVQLETTTSAVGGPSGIMNAQAQSLLNRTEYLNGRIDSLPVQPDIRVDPAGQYFGPSGVVIDSNGSFISGDAFIIRDDANNQWIMYLFHTVSGAPYVRTYYKTLPYSATLAGAWSAATEIPSMAGYSKMALLVDVDGNPVQVGGTYHGYAVVYTGTDASKLVYHWTATSLTGPWTLGANVLPRGAVGSKDENNTDTPYAIYNDGTVYLWYMGSPNASLPTYGLAVRMLRATATNPNGPFTKDYNDVLLPDSVNGKWDYGWMGGTQIRRRPNGRYMMVYNAGDTRPSSAGYEVATSRIGYAYSDSIDGPWLKDSGNPYFSPTGAPSDAVESTNIWRGHMAYDHLQGLWSMFYNTGLGGNEKITRADQTAYEYYYGVGVSQDVISITTSLQTVPNSRVNLPAGKYRVYSQINVIADSGALIKADIDTTLRVNGAIYKTNIEFIGSYAYENRDTIHHYIVTMPAAGYIDWSVKSNTALTGTAKLRRMRINVEKIN